MGFCNCSMFFMGITLCPFLFCNHLDGEERADCFALLSSWCLVIVVLLFLAVPWVCLQFLIVVFPDQIHLLNLDPDQSGSKLFAKDIIRRQISPPARKELNKAVNKSRLSSAQIL